MPSYPLILSLFDDSSPGHDGALIVEGDRLARFGVRLPMSTTTRLADSYGTRHHAAMGMAEQSDALVLVVSEERGQMAEELLYRHDRTLPGLLRGDVPRQAEVPTDQRITGKSKQALLR